MPPKKGRKKGKNEKKRKTFTIAGNVAICGVIVPGPQYELKTLVGYKGHCISMFRNPAYTFGKRAERSYEIIGPGPKYMLKERRQEGYTIGMAAVRRVTTIGPGTKYILPTDRGLSFSMKWRTKQRKVTETPGPGYVKPITDAPAFTM